MDNTENKRDFPMFEAGSGFIKGLIENLVFKIIGVERNAKLGARPSKK